VSYPTATEIAERIAELYEHQFGGKKRGRFRIDDHLMRKLAGREKLENEFIKKILDAAASVGLKVSKHEQARCYSVIEINKMLAWRKVPERVVDKLLVNWNN